MRSSPAISVLMPAYNCAPTVASAIASILDQDFPDIEIVVIDDGSTDATPDIIESIRDSRLHLVRQPRNSGVIDALNAGLRHCNGLYIARQDADDISLPRRLSLQAEVLQRNPNLSAIGAALQTVDSAGADGGIWRYPTSAAHSRWQCLFKTPVAHSAVMMRKSAVAALGGYRGDFPHAEDYDLWSRMLAAGDIVSLANPLVRYSLGEGGISRSRRELQRQAQLRISAGNMRRLLGRAIIESDCELLSLKLDEGRFSASNESALDAAGLCAELLEAFLAGESGDDRMVNDDYEQRMIGLARAGPWRSRLRRYRTIRHLDRSGRMGVRSLARALRP